MSSIIEVVEVRKTKAPVGALIATSKAPPPAKFVRQASGVRQRPSGGPENAAISRNGV